MATLTLPPVRQLPPSLASKRLMVLGAGPFQVPGIMAAVRLGHRVVSIDNRPDNPGHRLAYLSLHCDTRDKECVLRAARQASIDGIVAFRSESALAAQAHVADRLGLPGVTVASAAIMTDKARFRTFQREHGLPHPRCVSGAQVERLWRQATTLSCPVLVKPVDSYASQGITRLPKLEPEPFRSACALALAHSHAGELCVEEAVAGVEIGGDAFFADGRLALLCLTRKYLDGLRVIGHRIPAGVSGPDQDRVAAALATACVALGYRDGPLNFDVMLADDRVTILDLSPRNGGNGLAPLIQRATGIDLEEAMVRLALGEILDTSPWGAAMASPRGCGVAILGSDRPGKLVAAPSLGDFQLRTPGVFRVDWARQPGQTVAAFTHNGDAVAHVLFDCVGEEDYAHVVSHLPWEPGIQIAENR